MGDKYCRSYVDKIFGKYDKDGNNVLQRAELKTWLRNEIKDSPSKAEDIREKFMGLVATADTNGDGKIDRWEMYEHCLRTYQH